MFLQYVSEGMWILIGSILKGLVIYSIILFALWIINKRRTFKIKQLIIESILTIYMVALLKITGIIGMKFYISYVMSGIYNINLIPFMGGSIIMMFLNCLLFIPLGFLLPLVFKNSELDIKKVLIIGLMISLSIEVLQLFGGRYAEIDDVIMNTIGTLAGYTLYIKSKKLIHGKFKFIKGCGSGV